MKVQLIKSKFVHVNDIFEKVEEHVSREVFMDEIKKMQENGDIC